MHPRLWACKLVSLVFFKIQITLFDQWDNFRSRCRLMYVNQCCCVVLCCKITRQAEVKHILYSTYTLGLVDMKIYDCNFYRGSYPFIIPVLGHCEQCKSMNCSMLGNAWQCLSVNHCCSE